MKQESRENSDMQKNKMKDEIFDQIYHIKNNV